MSAQAQIMNDHGGPHFRETDHFALSREKDKIAESRLAHTVISKTMKSLLDRHLDLREVVGEEEEGMVVCRQRVCKMFGGSSPTRSLSPQCPTPISKHKTTLHPHPYQQASAYAIDCIFSQPCEL